MKFSRVWAMPSPDTFSIPPIAEFVGRYLQRSTCSVDPFARNTRLATHRNDLNPSTTATHHMEAVDFLVLMREQGIKCDLGLLDPPYSPRQIAEVYQSIGRTVTTEDTQSAVLKQSVRNAFVPILAPEAILLSFGWNTVGMGLRRDFEQIEIMLVCHGGDHNDTICLAERRLPQLFP